MPATAPLAATIISVLVSAFSAAALPIITAGPSAVPGDAFVGDSIRFTVTATDPDNLALTYRWRFGDSSSAAPYGTVSSSAYAYGQPGHYRASIYVKNANGEFVNAFLPITVRTRPTAFAPTHSTSILLDTSAGRVWCTNPDHGTIAALDAKAKTLLFEVACGTAPLNLARAPNGEIWVANRGSGTVTVHAAADGHILATLPMGYGSRPNGIVFNPAGTAAYVSLEGAGKLAKIDPVARSVSSQLALGPTPRALAVSGDGARILVSRFISPADHGEVWEVDAATFTKTRAFTLAYDTTPDTETGGGGVFNYLASIVISPDGTRALISAVKDNTQRGRFLSGVDLIAENTVRSGLAYLDLAHNVDLPGERNDFDNAAMASASIYNPGGDLIFSTLEGSNSEQTRDPYNNGAVLERNKAVGLAPIGLALDARSKTLYVHAFLGRAVSIWDVSPYNDRDAIAQDSVQSRPLGTIPTTAFEPLSPQVLQGKRVFYNAADSQMSFNGYISCAVCHLDGGSDGRVWDFTDRGEGLRRTTVLNGRSGMGHGPVHWSANFDEIQDFENDMRGPFGGKGFLRDADFNAGTRGKTLGDKKAGLSPELDALAAYVASLVQTNPSPFKNPDGSYTAEAAAGELIFNSAEAGCARCHIPPLYTDSRLALAMGDGAKPTLPPGDFLTPQGFLVHDVGTLKPSAGHRQQDTLLGIDTPTLKGVWDTPPYLHDGSAATLLDVIGSANAGDKHGKTSHLSAGQKAQLVAFLQQLDDGAVREVGIPRRPPAAGAGRMTLQRVGSGLRIGLAGLGDNAVVRLSDARGRVLWSARGGRELIWNGKDAAGARLPAGRYHVTATGGSTGLLQASASLGWIP